MNGDMGIKFRKKKRKRYGTKIIHGVYPLKFVILAGKLFLDGLFFFFFLKEKERWEKINICRYEIMS